MVVALCDGKFKDDDGKVLYYSLVDTNGKRSNVTGVRIKNAIKAGSLKVLNMELSDSGRLTERSSTKEEQVLVNIYGALSDLYNTNRFCGDPVYCTEYIQRQISNYFGFDKF